VRFTNGAANKLGLGNGNPREGKEEEGLINQIHPFQSLALTKQGNHGKKGKSPRIKPIPIPDQPPRAQPLGP